MKRKRLVLAGIAVAAAVGLVIAASLGAFASNGRTAAAGAGADHVTVHGHWTVVVRSTSGKVVGRYHFHNDFVTSGAFSGPAAFAGILSGSNTAGDWDVSLNGSACPASNGNFCQMYEPDSNPNFFASPPDTKNLTVTVPSSGTDAFKIVLAGSVNATDDGTITRVSTGLQKCPPGSTTGADCGIGVGYNAITDRTLPSAISVLSGQSIAVTVKLSFS